MNTLVIVLIAAVVLVCAYAGYGRWLAKTWGITGYRRYVWLATGPGGLKPIWILAPVTGRISGSLQ